MHKYVRGIPPNEGREYPKQERKIRRKVEETNEMG